MSNPSPYLIGALFTTAGVLHFAAPQFFTQIVPPYIPDAKAVVAISGAAEFLGGVGSFVPGTRKAAGIGLIALLAAVFPANLYMATDYEKFKTVAPLWGLLARLPLQAVLGWWVWASLVSPKPATE